MKKFLKFVAAWKTGASLMFSAAVAIYLVFCWFFGEARVPVGVLWGLLLACLAGSLLQGVCFSQWVIRRMRYSLRLAPLVPRRAAGGLVGVRGRLSGVSGGVHGGL